MDKEMDKSRNGCITDADGLGTVKIANDVVAMIAGLAATEVDGVSAMSGNITDELMGKVGIANITMKKQTKGVKVDILEGTVSVDLALTLEYGYNIPATCNKVQEKVKSALETMTGFEVSDVNIRIIGIKMQENK
ncbi:MAG: Asp23/Gls24 family envelope stress response protein [Lachnospiraceae bacterium]|nr:Asp23/Gls24 family envelope stress response protein [Lachnospiraceae bacterium]